MSALLEHTAPSPLRRRDEGGAIAVVAAVLMFVLVAILAFVIDVAGLRAERADAQGAADNAAISAAWASCNGLSDTQAQAAGQAVATDNGYPAAKAVVARDGNLWRVSIDASVSTSFSPLLGAGSALDSSVQAVARGACAPGAPLPALYAGSETCGDKTFEWSGSNSTVNGGVHSNDDIKFGGENDVNGDGTYVGSADSPDKIDWNPTATNPSATSVRPWPVGYTIADYSPSPGGTRTVGPDFFAANTEINEAWLVARGLYNTTTKQITPGTYYSSVGIDLGSMGGARGTVTLVASGQIKISPSDLDIQPYEDGLLVFSDYNGGCDTFGIDISGSDNDWEGVVFAPRAQVKYAGSSGFTLSGSIIAYSLQLSGSGWTITSGGSSAPSDKTILLEQ